MILVQRKKTTAVEQERQERQITGGEAIPGPKNLPQEAVQLC